MKLKFDTADYYFLFGCFLYGFNYFSFENKCILNIAIGFCILGVIQTISKELRPTFCVQFDTIQLTEAVKVKKESEEK